MANLIKVTESNGVVIAIPTAGLFVTVVTGSPFGIQSHVMWNNGAGAADVKESIDAIIAAANA